jgi:hypothetical protein
MSESKYLEALRDMPAEERHKLLFAQWPIPIDFSEHVCFDHDCTRIMGVEHHVEGCPKRARREPQTIREARAMDEATHGKDICDALDKPPKQETWRDRKGYL